MEERPCERKIREVFERIAQKYASLEEFARKAVVPVSFLEALRDGRWECMPEAVYIKGFLRRISEELDMNYSELEEAISQCIINKDISPDISSVKVNRRGLRISHTWIISVLILLTAFLLVVYYYGWSIKSENKNVSASKNMASYSSGNFSSSNITGSNNATVPSKLVVDVIRGKCWYRWVDGSKVDIGFFTNGTVEFICRSLGCYLKLGRPEAVRLRYKGKVWTFHGTKPILLKITNSTVEVLRGAK